MCIRCVPSYVSSDLRCAVCGQGFLLYFPRLAKGDRDSMHCQVQAALRGQHAEIRGGHPREAFTVEFMPDAVPAFA